MNNRGTALILSYMVIAVLTILGSAFVAGSISESNIVRRFADSTRAFWVAEAGMAQAYYNWSQTDNPGSGGSFGGGSYSVTKNMTQVTVTAASGSSSKTLRAAFVRIPVPFDNSLSTGGNLLLRGLAAKTDVHGKTRITGDYYREGAWAEGWFEDKQTGVSADDTIIKVPDFSGNGTRDEFADFVGFGQQAVASYPPSQVVYIEDNGTVSIFPNQSLVGKKVIFVKGSSAGTGNVNIFFDATWRANEDLTVISTGTITYVEPLQFQTNARLSTISWGDYIEASIFRSEHQSVVYSHDDANFVDILEWGSTTGNVIANDTVKDYAAGGDPNKDGISLIEFLTYEQFYFSNRAKNGDMPPGFQLLSGSSGTRCMKYWQEQQQ